MTRNQIEFWRLRETERANRAVEAHNAKVLAYNYAVLAENKRANLAREAENERSNRQAEFQNRVNAYNSFMLATRQQAEINRSNKANEALTKQRLVEQTRSNKASEVINTSNAYTNRLMALVSNRQAVETERYNRSVVAQRYAALNETVRSDIAQETLASQRQLEQQRSNMANERISTQKNIITLNQLSETRRHNVAVESETVRHDQMEERLKTLEMALRTAGDTMKSYSMLSKFKAVK